ncbi:MAG: DUF86 domain-containing protein [Planctomycetes bacterium]|nr:DUF86 domain-containing protein [Planctomycetota bacterium]
MNVSLVGQKLARIAEYCRELEPLSRIPVAEFESRPDRHHLAERYVQLIVDSAVDINNHAILESGSPPPEKYFDTFVAMGRLHILPEPLARRLARTTGLRNRIVHEYEAVDLRIFHRSLPSFIRDFAEFARRLRKRAGI